jgi:hypothetical protein
VARCEWNSQPLRRLPDKPLISVTAASAQLMIEMSDGQAPAVFLH